MDVKQLQYFVVSVDMGSFHSAAEALITTQPNVSKIIKSLEDELNMTLLKRNRNGVTITPEGEKVYNYAIEILKNMKLINNFKEERHIEKLSISSVPSNTLSKFLAEFYNDGSDKNIKIDFCESNVEDIMKKVHRRNYELGFVYISKRNMSAFLKDVKSKGLKYYELTKNPLCLFVGEKSSLYKCDSIDERSIRGTKLIQHYEDQYSIFNHLGHLKEDIFYIDDETSISYTNSDHFLIQLVKNTEFCSIGNSFIKDKYEYYGIRSIPIYPCEEQISFGYIKRNRDELSDIGKDFIEYLKGDIGIKE